MSDKHRWQNAWKPVEGLGLVQVCGNPQCGVMRKQVRGRWYYYSDFEGLGAGLHACPVNYRAFGDLRTRPLAAPSAGQTLPAETSVPAQLGTGSGAGAQSDSGADSGHATSAVPCLHTSVSEAETLDAQLCKFYGVSTFPELVAAMERHIEKLQAKLPPSPSLAPQQVRQG